MLIKVIYQDGKIGEIERYELDDFIALQKNKKVSTLWQMGYYWCRSDKGSERRLSGSP